MSEKRYSVAAGKDLVQISNTVYVTAGDQMAKSVSEMGSAIGKTKNAVSAGGTSKGLGLALDAFQDTGTAVGRTSLALGGTAVSAAVVITAGVGTAIGQLASNIGYRIFSWFSSSVEPTIEPTSSYVYRPPSDDEIEKAIKKAMKSSGAPDNLLERKNILALDEFVDGAGTAIWNFLFTGMKNLIVRLRALAADGTKAIENRDLSESAAQFAHAANIFASYLGYSRPYIVDPRQEFEAARVSLELLREHAGDLHNSADIRLSVSASLEALKSTEAAFSPLRDRSSILRPIEGKNGVIPTINKDEFLKFVQACATKGESALPKHEIEIFENLLLDEGLRLAQNQSAGAHIAEFVAKDETDDEAALFPRSGELPISVALYIPTKLRPRKNRTK